MPSVDGQDDQDEEVGGEGEGFSGRHWYKAELLPAQSAYIYCRVSDDVKQTPAMISLDCSGCSMRSRPAPPTPPRTPAARRAARAPFEDLGFARVDHHRAVRQGFPEVVLGLGKTPAQIAAIAAEIVSRGSTLLVTRAEPRPPIDAVRAVVPGATYHADARLITLRQQDVAPGKGTILVAARRHVRPAGRRRGGAHRRTDGQHGRPSLRRRRRRAPSPARRARAGWRRRASSSSSPAWKARCRASSPGW